MTKFLTTIVLVLILSTATLAQQITPNIPQTPAQPQQQETPQVDWLSFPTDFLCGTYPQVFSTIAIRGQVAVHGGAAAIISTRSGTPYPVSTVFSLNLDTGEWSMIGVLRDGMACIIASGSNYTIF